MSKSEVLNTLINYYDKGNKSQFAKRIGVKAQTINTWLSRDTFDADLLYAKCEGIDANFLLSGKGDMFISYHHKNTSTVRDKSSYGIVNNKKGIPLIPLSAMAGALSENNQQVMDYECDRYVIPSLSGADFLITVKGNSMSPTYSSGDLVACKKLKRDTFFQWNKTYVLDTDQGALIKRVQPGKDQEHITIVSDNKDYAPFELAVEHIYSIALVVGMIRME